MPGRNWYDPYWNPGEKPRSRALYASAILVGFGSACLQNNYAGYPMLKRPQGHLFRMFVGATGAWLVTKYQDWMYNTMRRRMLTDTQLMNSTRITIVGSLHEMPKRLPDAYTKLDRNKPYWYPYDQEGEEKAKHFKHIYGQDMWQGNLDYMDARPEFSKK